MCAAVNTLIYCVHGRFAYVSPAKNAHDPRSFTKALEVSCDAVCACLLAAADPSNHAPPLAL